MRKNRLIEEMNKVIEKNNRLFSKCEDLEKSLSDKNQLIAELTATNAQVLAENELLKAELEARVEAVSSAACERSSNIEDAVEEAVPDICDEHDTSVEADGITAESSEEVEREDTIKYIAPVNATTALMAESKINTASQSIGRIVLKCAELCNTFAAVGDINSKDLINLALGRTEVFKSEVLQLAVDCDSAEQLINELDLKEKAVLEYFELLSNQL